MPEIQVGARPEEIRQSARHTLFVEGNHPSSIDPILLSILLFDTNIRVEPLGPSYHVRSAAEALYVYHPDYYYLIDRDHYNDNTVEDSWRNFPDTNTSNLLIWRRRELENYFLISDYLMQSEYINCSRQQLEECIIQTASSRIFCEAVNMVIVGLREELKTAWIECFNSSTGLETKEMALAMLVSMAEFSFKKRSVSQKLRNDLIEDRFNQIIDNLFGKNEELLINQGKWLELTRGKYILPTVINNCFRVTDRNGNVLQGNIKVKEVTEELLRKPLNEQPQDFQELYTLICDRVNS